MLFNNLLIRLLRQIRFPILISKYRKKILFLHIRIYTFWSAVKVYNLQKYYESIIKQYFLKESYSDEEPDLNNFKKSKHFSKTIILLEKRNKIFL